MANSNYLRLRCAALTLCILASGVQAFAEESCPDAEVNEHVKQQIHLYGPRSRKREYFGFIYRDGQTLNSSVVRGPLCNTPLNCSVDSRGAASGLPRGAKVLGEWHTHPSGGSNTLSANDVRGAWNNRKIRCYTAYYATANGKFYSWVPASSSVPVAMGSRVLLGDYRKPEMGPVIIAAHQDPGSKCLSTNTNALTAATTTKSCKRSATNR